MAGHKNMGVSGKSVVGAEINPVSERDFKKIALPSGKEEGARKDYFSEGENVKALNSSANTLKVAQARFGEGPPISKSEKIFDEIKKTFDSSLHLESALQDRSEVEKIGAMATTNSSDPTILAEVALRFVKLTEHASIPTELLSSAGSAQEAKVIQEMRHYLSFAKGARLSVARLAPFLRRLGMYSDGKSLGVLLHQKEVSSGEAKYLLKELGYMDEYGEAKLNDNTYELVEGYKPKNAMQVQSLLDKLNANKSRPARSLLSGSNAIDDKIKVEYAKMMGWDKKEKFQDLFLFSGVESSTFGDPDDKWALVISVLEDGTLIDKFKDFVSLKLTR